MKDKMATMERWFEAATSEGEEAVQEHLRVMARMLGNQVARSSNPDDMPKGLTTTVEELGKGVTAGILMQHGRAGMMDVRMFSISRGKS